MKTVFYSLLLAAALAGPSAAQTDLAGTWQGRLELAPGQTLAIHFVISAAPGGGYSAIVTSPDSGAIKNVPAASVAFADGKLTVDVPALSGGYAGTLRDGALEGEWSQEGAKLPLSLRPYETPTLTQADIDVLRGEWFGKLNAAGLEVTIVLRFSTGEDGALRAVLDVPEQGAKDLPATDVALDDNHFSVAVSVARAEITGMLEGEQIVGQWKQAGSAFPLTLKKGQYVAAAPTLSQADIDVLRGEWFGKLAATPGSEATIVLRFSAGNDGALRAVLDVPEQGVKDWAAAEIALDDGHFSLKVPAARAEITGILEGEQIGGQWNQLGNAIPLTLKKGQYVAPASYLELAVAAREQLEGRWSGTLNGLAVIVRFETDAQGRTLGFFDSTQQKILNIPITQAELAGTKLTFRVVYGATYAGELADNKLTGAWTQAGFPAPLPLTLTREK
jgi:hypothetical protein